MVFSQFTNNFIFLNWKSSKFVLVAVAGIDYSFFEYHPLLTLATPASSTSVETVPSSMFLVECLQVPNIFNYFYSYTFFRIAFFSFKSVFLYLFFVLFLLWIASFTTCGSESSLHIWGYIGVIYTQTMIMYLSIFYEYFNQKVHVLSSHSLRFWAQAGSNFLGSQGWPWAPHLASTVTGVCHLSLNGQVAYSLYVYTYIKIYKTSIQSDLSVLFRHLIQYNHYFSNISYH